MTTNTDSPNTTGNEKKYSSAGNSVETPYTQHSASHSQGTTQSAPSKANVPSGSAATSARGAGMPRPTAQLGMPEPRAELASSRILSTTTEQASPWRQSIAARYAKNPLVIAAAAIAVGAVIGFAIPLSAPERKLMGPSRDQLLGKAKKLAQGRFGSAQGFTKLASNATQLLGSSQAGAQAKSNSSTHS